MINLLYIKYVSFPANINPQNIQLILISSGVARVYFAGVTLLFFVNIIYFATIAKPAVATYINHSLQRQFMAVRVGGNRSTRRKPNCPTQRLPYHLTYIQYIYLNHGTFINIFILINGILEYSEYTYMQYYINMFKAVLLTRIMFLHNYNIHCVYIYQIRRAQQGKGIPGYICSVCGGGGLSVHP